MDVHVVDQGLSFELSGRLLLEPTNIIVRIGTTEGVEGVGSATANLNGRGIAQAIAELRPLLIGEDAQYRERIWQRLLAVSVAMVPPQALAAIDCALWDLAGKAADLPIHQLLGAQRDRVPCYASTLTYESIDEFLSVIDGCMTRGFRAIKLHGWGDATRDIELCGAVRDHVGSDIGLMLDAVGAYDLPSAMRVGRAIQDLGFEWFEMPIRDQSMFGYRQLAAALDIPITSGEVHTYAFQEAANYLMHGCWDFVRIDATLSGGITGAKKAASLAEGFGVQCELHSFGYTLSMAANLQVAGAIANCKYFEVPLPLDGYDVGMETIITIDDCGDAHVPQAPGLGVSVDWERMTPLIVATH